MCAFFFVRPARAHTGASKSRHARSLRRTLKSLRDIPASLRKFPQVL
jgi:hypothetical protein